MSRRIAARPRFGQPRRCRSFATVRAIGLELPGVEATTRYDGSPVLQVGGAFLAGLARHPSAARGTLIVRAQLDDRKLLIEDAPETYYVTDYYRPYPVVLARLASLDREALRDLLHVSWRLTQPKARGARRSRSARSSSRRRPV